MRSYTGFLLVFFKLLSACASEPKLTDEEAFLTSNTATPMSQQDLEQLYAQELSVSIEHPEGSGTATSYPDGTAQMIFNDRPSTGQWRIADGTRCDAWDGRRETCKRVYKVSDTEYIQFELNGDRNSRLIVQQ
jgi:hypothetical protein